MDGLCEPDPPSRLLINDSKDFFEAWATDKLLKVSAKKLLERLSSSPGSALKFAVDIFGEITDKNIWHAFIM